ncbi:hypothetical protein LPJ66_005180 [Kickxella alabastrina]|uniref:Uncharacterized protein n=1 Tax=Kickxella alabastrina TaxID=61397 RepID=A0ACC1IJ74_9FUNG|nr:hypothetical protein LPJ66_005180 [Kickxella alabastrina]
MSVAPLIVKARGLHTASVIFIHGLGDSGYGWKDMAADLSSKLPHVKFILPHAPEQPVTINNGFRMPSWYDIKSLSKIANDDDEVGMNASMMKINQVIRSELDAGIPANRIVLGGFSQGGAMALFTGLQSEFQLGGLVVLSGYLPMRERLLARATDCSKKIPIFQGHGTADEVVMYQYGKVTSDALTNSGYNIEFNSYDYMGHSACSQELDDLKDFLQKNIPENVVA